MPDQQYVTYECTPPNFQPLLHHPVRWLEWEQDYPLVQVFWPVQTPGGWQEAREQGFRYCAVIEHGQIQAIAAVWRYSEPAWEVASVYTRPEARRRGYAQAVVCFATAAILGARKRATCSTAYHNRAMQAVAESVGFQRVT
jgi:RimJ/RimL family protein N-acetyltransferase